VFSQHVLANVVLLVAAFQLGGLPFTLEQIEAGLAQRGAAAEDNRQAFTWGRWVAHAPERVTTALDTAHAQVATVNPYDPTPAAQSQAQALVDGRDIPQALCALVSRRVAQVIDYQDVGVARRYLELVELAITRERAHPPQAAWPLAHAVAQAWFKLITYKDEYEVARLHGATQYDRIARELGIDGPYELRYQLHPPALRRLGMQKKLPLGLPYKLGFALLRRMKRLRGTPFDVFGWDPDRRLERAVMTEYRELMRRSLKDPSLSHAQLVERAESALMIKGYAGIKEQAIARWRARVASLTAPTPALTAGAAP
jgi:indolepyruvate ferredoxin oxidoreductase